MVWLQVVHETLPPILGDSDTLFFPQFSKTLQVFFKDQPRPGSACWVFGRTVSGQNPEKELLDWKAGTILSINRDHGFAKRLLKAMSHSRQTHRTRQEERNDPKCNWAKSLKCCLWEQAVPSSRDSCQNSKFIRTVSNVHYVLPFWWFSSHTASIGTRPLFHLWGTCCWFITKLQQGCVKTHQAPRTSIT